MSSYVNDKETTVGTAVAALVGVIALTVFTLIWAGFWSGLTLSVLWGWFVAPTFGIPSIGVAQAYGLCLVVGALKGWKKVEKDADSWGVTCLKVFFGKPALAALILSVGWVAKGFI